MYQIVRSQWIVAGLGTPIAINQATVLAVLNLYKVDDVIDCFEKIVYLSQLDINKMNEKTKT